MEEFDVEEWMVKLICRLQDAFGERLRFAGLQGSRARGEAREGSDIDAVIIIDDCNAQDLEGYRNVIRSMPHADIACGFVGSVDVLANWSRYDVFNLVMDTKPLYGSLDFMDTDFTSEDALHAAKAGACEIYHALGHTSIFDPDHLPQILKGCIKSSFFIMRALWFAKTGEYPASRQRMKALASQDELSFLEAYDFMGDGDVDALSRSLFDWASRIIESTPN